MGYTLDPGIPTLAEVLSNEGWTTAGFVSAFVLDRRWGIGRGFDHYFDDFDLSDFETPNLSSVQRSGDVTIAEAVRWLDDRPQDSPFFLWLHLYDPHDPTLLRNHSNRSTRITPMTARSPTRTRS